MIDYSTYASRFIHLLFTTLKRLTFTSYNQDNVLIIRTVARSMNEPTNADHIDFYSPDLKTFEYFSSYSELTCLINAKLSLSQDLDLRQQYLIWNSQFCHILHWSMLGHVLQIPQIYHIFQKNNIISAPIFQMCKKNSIFWVVFISEIAKTFRDRAVIYKAHISGDTIGISPPFFFCKLFVQRKCNKKLVFVLYYLIVRHFVRRGERGSQEEKCLCTVRCN